MQREQKGADRPPEVQWSPLQLRSGKTAEACASSNQGAASDRLRQAEQTAFGARGSALQACHLPGPARTLDPFLQSHMLK